MPKLATRTTMPRPNVWKRLKRTIKRLLRPLGTHRAHWEY